MKFSALSHRRVSFRKKKSSKNVDTTTPKDEVAPAAGADAEGSSPLAEKAPEDARDPEVSSLLCLVSFARM